MSKTKLIFNKFLRAEIRLEDVFHLNEPQTKILRNDFFPSKSENLKKLQIFTSFSRKKTQNKRKHEL
jgi:hypothetical protein